MHYFPPLTSSVLSSQWSPDPTSPHFGRDSIYPSGAVQEDWENRLNTNYTRYRFAVTWNNYEDPRYRNSFDSQGNEVPPNGTVDWVKNKYGVTRDIINLNSVVDPAISSYSLYSLPKGTDKNVINRTMWASFPTAPIFKSSGEHGLYFHQYYPYLKTIYKLDENGDQKGDIGNKKIPIFRMSYNHLTDKQEYAAFSRPNRLDGKAIKITNNERAGWLPAQLNALSSNDLLYGSSTISIIFREYVHYIGNPLGGTGLLDLTPFTVNATTYVERHLKTDIYSPYSLSTMDLVVDYNNQLPIHLWPKTHLIGLP